MNNRLTPTEAERRTRANLSRFIGYQEAPQHPLVSLAIALLIAASIVVMIFSLWLAA